MAIKKAALSQFISLCNCLLLQLSLCFAHTYHHHHPPSLSSSSSSSSWSLNYSLKSLSQSVPLLSLHLAPHSFFLTPAILPPRLYLATLLLASPYTASHLCITGTLINPGFVLLQKGVGCPSGSTLIAVWEHGPGLLSTSPLLYFSLVILYSHSNPPAFHHQCCSECLIYPLIFTSYLYILFLLLSLRSVSPSPAVPHFTLM